jgi:hypothetical protein
VLAVAPQDRHSQDVTYIISSVTGGEEELRRDEREGERERERERGEGEEE